MQKRYAKGCAMDGKFTPHMKKRIAKLMVDASHVKLLPGREDNFEVLKGKNRYAINLTD